MAALAASLAITYDEKVMVRLPKSSKELREEIVQTVEEDVKKLEQTVKAETSSQVAKVQAHGREFLDFIRQRGVVGLAVGIIIGAAVTTVVNSLVQDVINPLLGLVMPNVNQLSAATLHVGKAEVGLGSLAVATINFLIVALVIFASFKIFKLDKLDKDSKAKSKTDE